ncbi:MHYT domain-containing protein [Brasilonema sp. UFV-L1]|uniref:MHYT domain-containing protein n=1 Tax=Brasilonema sp. UFV-L1 TaxID=2234130 RepID=UPI00145F5A19|nr:MHYT domain-containing protein [Brasilonema sp. UFV-L1]NMG08344.1 PAS domain S-box protein [Brasilonema sp. UFV-L1]
MLQEDFVISSSYDSRLVGLSIVISVLASYTALDLAGRVTAAKAPARFAWLIGGGIVMGIGIWSMHFVAMLAFSLPMPMSYDMWTVLVSMLPAMIASVGALFLASRRVLSLQQLLIGGTLMGIGIASMHYIGMYAMLIDATIEYNYVLVIISVAIAIGASIVALWIAFQLRTQTSTIIGWTKIGSAFVMGGAIAGMHYTGIAAAHFKAVHSRAIMTPQAMTNSLTWLAVCIGIATVVILSFALLTSFVDQRLTASAKLLEQQEVEVMLSVLFTEITLRIRRSLKLEDVLNTTVKEVRQALTADRVVIYRFNSDWSGTIIAESVAESLVKSLGQTVNHPFPEDYIEMYKNGRVRATSNIYKAGFADCHRKILEDFQIKANLVAPILKNHQLTGLLCAHQCFEPRKWQKSEIDLFRQLAIQVGIALEQANLLDELQQAQKVLRLRDRAIAAVSNAIFISDPHQPDNPIIFCNPAFETITGYSQEDVLGCNYRFLLGTDTNQTTVEQVNNGMRDSGDESQVIVKSYRKDGTLFWCELTVSPVRDAFGRVTNFIGVLSDITLRKQAEEQVKRSKEVLQRQLLELIDDIKDANHADLTVRAKISAGEIGILADFLNTIIDSLQRIVTQVKTVANQVNVSIKENSSAIEQVADEVLTQVDEITHILENIDNMTLSIQTVTENARQAAGAVHITCDAAQAADTAMDFTINTIESLQQIVAETANTVKSVGETSQKISSLASLMKQIDRQANLLVINAGVEAAWMGDASRAFILVAEEIAQLVAKSAEVTKEIEQIFDNIQSQTTEVIKAIEQGTIKMVNGANVVEDAKLYLRQILEMSRQIDDLVQLIFTATISETQTSQIVVSSMKEIAQAFEQTADSSRMVSHSLQETREVALQLQDSVGVFKTEVSA